MNGYIITSDKYNLLLEGYIELYLRNWNDNSIFLKILGFNEPNFNLNSNFKFESLGKQIDFPNWSTPLEKYFNSITDEFFFLCFEDHYLIDRVNVEILNEGIEYISNDPTIDKIYITGNDYSHEITKHYKNNYYLSEYISNQTNKSVHCSLLPSIWRKSSFLKMLNNSKTGTCHDFEQKNKKIDYNFNTLLVKDFVIYPNLDCVRKGRFNTNIFELYNTNKILGTKLWMKRTNDLDVFKKMKIKWDHKNV